MRRLRGVALPPGPARAAVVLLLALPGLGSASDTCPPASPFPILMPGGVGAPECFGTVDWWGFYFAPISWNGDDHTDLLIGVAGDFIQTGATHQSVEVWLGGPEWGPRAYPDVVSDHSEGASADTVLSRIFGDTNGDGFDEVSVSWSNWSSMYCSASDGAVYDASGPVDGPSLGAAPVAFTLHPWDKDVGDVNGDGFDDRVLPDELTLGGPDGAWSPNAVVFDQEHRILRGLGDVNGDGYADLEVESVDPLEYAISWVAGGAEAVGAPQLLAVAGMVYPVGDLDGDGTNDVLVATEGEFVNDPHTVTIHRGSMAGPDPEGDEVDVGLRDLVFRRATAGDVNGDGLDDLLLVHNPYDFDQGVYAPEALLYLGTPSGLAAGPSWVGGMDGWIVGDLDADGLADIVAAGGTPLPPDQSRLGVWMLPGRHCPDDLDCDGALDLVDCAPYTGVAREGAPEVCDGWDNDCDGTVDEAPKQAPKQAATCGEPADPPTGDGPATQPSEASDVERAAPPPGPVPASTGASSCSTLDPPDLELLPLIWVGALSARRSRNEERSTEAYFTYAAGSDGAADEEIRVRGASIRRCGSGP